MNAIPKRIHYDKDGRPEEVVLRYEDWVRLTAPSDLPSAPDRRRWEDLLKAVQGKIDFGDGLEYQRRLRAEWDDR